jgi:hypothetical protein
MGTRKLRILENNAYGGRPRTAEMRIKGLTVL